MSLIELTADALGQLLGREIPDAHVLVAKNSVLGLDSQGIADLLGVDLAEVQELEADPHYKEVRLIIAAKQNEAQLETAATWDDIERKSLKNITNRIDYEKDLEKNLRVAMVANRATRRVAVPRNDPLDASKIADRVNITLSKRVIERLSNSGAERETTQKLSITGGGASNISFAEVSEHLGIGPRRVPAGTPTGDVQSEDLLRLMRGSVKR